MLGNMAYMNTEIKSSLERGRTEFKAGDIAFIPGQRCICFVIGPYVTKSAMTPLGSIDGDITIQAGDVAGIYEEP